MTLGGDRGVRRKEVIERIGAVYREHGCAALALARLQADAERDANVLAPLGLRTPDVRTTRGALEATYLARMFAVFEAHLRDVWTTVLTTKDTHPKARDLLDGCAARQHVRHGVLADAHAVREYRNFVIHGSPAAYVPLEAARERLCTFFGRMPAEW